MFRTAYLFGNNAKYRQLTPTNLPRYANFFVSFGKSGAIMAEVADRPSERSGSEGAIF